MFSLMQRCYVNTCRESFERDLAAKQWVLRVCDPITGDTVGFSTQVVFDLAVEGREVRVLFSGDTVVAPDHWGDPALANAWGRFALGLIDESVPGSLYWFLTSKGFRTYRYLPLFFRRFTPGADQTPTDLEGKLIASLGAKLAPGRFNRESGIIEASSSKERVRPELAAPRDRAKFDPHVQFFLEANPQYSLGDELCCLAPLSRDNFTWAAWRVIQMPSRASGAVSR
ncbi:MAG: hypothetical protein KDA37_06065 [Planctomycetales bacterium]|nr:hypothetical protein [Planctomycetales bacterium]